MENLKLKLKQALVQKLPGEKAHRQMAPYAARLDVPIPVNAHPAAVLVLLYERSGNLYFPLITRINTKANDVHRGQISLPGGRKDTLDVSIQDTAIRECAEEIGIISHDIEILGALSPLYIPVSNHHVFPFIAWYPKIPVYKLQIEEVEALHEVPLNAISDSGIKVIKTMYTSEGHERKVPTMEWESLNIWGATAMILEELAELYREL